MFSGAFQAYRWIFCSSPFAVISQWLTASTERDQKGKICRQYDNKTCRCTLALHRLHVAAVAAIDLISTRSRKKKNNLQNKKPPTRTVSEATDLTGVDSRLCCKGLGGGYLFPIVVPPSQHHQMLTKSPLFAPQLFWSEPFGYKWFVYS